MALLETLKDSFTGSSIDTTKWWVGGAADISSNRLWLKAGWGGSDFSYIDSKSTYNMTGSYMEGYVLDNGEDHTNLVYRFTIYMYFGGSYEWEFRNGTLAAKKGSTTVWSSTWSTVFGGVDYGKLRIRESGGTVYFDTAAAGTSTWTNRATSDTSGYDVTEVTVQMYHGWFTTPAFSSTVIMDDLNPGITIHSASLSGSITYGGTVSHSQMVHYRQAGGTIAFTGQAVGRILSTLSEIERKTYLAKIYDEEDNFVGLWNDVADQVEFSREINSAGSAMTVELARTADSLGRIANRLVDTSNVQITDNNGQTIATILESPNQIGDGSSVQYNYRVKIWVFYGRATTIQTSTYVDILDSSFNPLTATLGAPNGIVIFDGFISDIAARYGSTETTVVTLSSFGHDLDNYVVKSGSNTTVAFNSYDPSDIIRDGIDAFKLASGSPLNYEDNSVEMTGTVVSYTFKLNTYLELLKKALELAPSDWFYYVDLGTNLIHFKGRPATPDHVFNLGREIQSLELRGNIENVINEVYFTGAESSDVPLFKRYVETPAAKTRRGLKRLTDSRVTLASTAQLLSESEIERNNQIVYRSTLTVLDKAYDIESIDLGDLIGFRNFGNFIDALELQVVGIKYTPEAVELTLGSLLPKVSKRVEDILRNQKMAENQNLPTAPIA